MRRDTVTEDGLILYAAPDKMELETTIDGVPTTLATNTNATSSVNQWYNVRAIFDGEHVEVWRGAPGQTMTFVFSTEGISGT